MSGMKWVNYLIVKICLSSTKASLLALALQKCLQKNTPLFSGKRGEIFLNCFFIEHHRATDSEIEGTLRTYRNT